VCGTYGNEADPKRGHRSEVCLLKMEIAELRKTLDSIQLAAQRALDA
jgi:hypothetical protein